jgi:hypothetical protein
MTLTEVGNPNIVIPYGKDWSREIRTTRPMKFVMWRRWLESIDVILDNGTSIDLDVDEDEEYGLDDWMRKNPDLIRGLPLRPEYPVGAVYGEPRYKRWLDLENKWYEKVYPRASKIFRENVNRRQLFEMLLERKREDNHYGQVVDSLRLNGFIRPLTATENPEAKYGFTFGDGHHRLAAAIDLGFSHVPLQIAKYTVANDSGSWYLGDRVERTNRSNPEWR